MTHFYLIRHGQTLWNLQSRIQGQLDSPLTEKGLRGAEAIAERLASVPLDALYSSDLERAVQTAQAINRFHDLPLQTRNDLREVDFGAWEGKTSKELETDETEADLLAKWREDSFTHRPPGGERLEALQDRVVRAIEEMAEKHPQGKVAVVSHGGAIKAAISWIAMIPLRHWRRFEIDNVSLSRFSLGDPRGPMLHTVNDTSHFPEER